MAQIGDTNVPLLPVSILVAGGYIAWFAVHYWRDTTQVYPSGPIKDLLTGKGLPAPVREGSTTDPNAAATGFDAIAQAAQNAATYESNQTAQAVSTAAGQGTGYTGGTQGGEVSTSLSRYSTSQMEALWTQLGGDPDYAAWAAAIVNAESSGIPTETSYNTVGGGTNVGLFQLETPGGVGAGHTIDELKDPSLNTQITIMATKNGTDWSDWGDPVTAAYGYKGIKNFTGGG